MNITRIGLDLAKHVFQVHGVSSSGKTVLRKTLRREQVRSFFAQVEPCLIGMESCGGAHFWARELRALGHDVRLIAPQFVQPYRKSGKNDENDAEAICEAAGRPNMRFVPIKDVEQQAVLTLHRARQLALGERTTLVNQLRGLLAEYGLVIAQGIAQARRQVPTLLEDGENGLPSLAREIFAELYEQLRCLDQRLAEYDQRIARLVRAMPQAQRLMQVEGVGPLIATALVASVGDARLGASWRLGWVWYRGNTRAVARPAWDASPSAATSTCARC